MGAIFVGGKHKGTTVPNNIRATVRAGRSKESYDEVAAKISKKWEEVVINAKDGDCDGKEEGKVEKGKKLYAVVFVELRAAMEGGLVVPAVGLLICFDKIETDVIVGIGWRRRRLVQGAYEAFRGDGCGGR